MDWTPVLAMDDEVIGMVVVTGGLMVAIVAILGSVVKSIVKAKLRESTRREIAAYIAEGSMTYEEGERLLMAAPPGERGGCC